MKFLTTGTVTGFAIFSAGALLNYFGSNPRILYLPAVGACVWIMFQTHEYVASKELSMKPDDGASVPGANITSHNQSGGFTGINQGTVNLGPSKRRIDSTQEKTLLSTLRTAPKGKVEIVVTESDLEAVAFARQIESLLKQAGYDVNFGLMMMMSGPMGAPVGLGFTVASPNDVPPQAQAIGDAFVRVGLHPEGSVNPDRKADVLYITVGAKPLDP